jgi:hypothetical protein
MRILLVYKHTQKIVLSTLIVLLAPWFFCAGVSRAEEPLLEDPTKPSDFVGSSFQGAEAVSGDLRLEAIIISGTRKMAVINQKILEVGDRVGGKEIIAIEDAQVVLRENKKKDSILPLLNRKIKDIAL